MPKIQIHYHMFTIIELHIIAIYIRGVPYMHPPKKDGWFRWENPIVRNGWLRVPPFQERFRPDDGAHISLKNPGPRPVSYKAVLTFLFGDVAMSHKALVVKKKNNQRKNTEEALGFLGPTFGGFRDAPKWVESHGLQWRAFWRFWWWILGFVRDLGTKKNQCSSATHTHIICTSCNWCIWCIPLITWHMSTSDPFAK